MILEEIKTKSGGLVIINDGDIFDVTPFLPDTEKAEEFLPKLNSLADDYTIDMTENAKRIVGMQKHCLLKASEGNRNSTLFELAAFIRDLNEEPDEYVIKMNSMFSKPLPEKEIRQILRSSNR